MGGLDPWSRLSSEAQANERSQNSVENSVAAEFECGGCGGRSIEMAISRNLEYDAREYVATRRMSKLVRPKNTSMRHPADAISRPRPNVLTKPDFGARVRHHRLVTSTRRQRRQQPTMEALWKIAAPVSVGLTLATWLFFKYATATSADSLGPSELTFVFAFWFALTLVVRWLWNVFAKKQTGGPPHETPRP